MHKRKTTLTVLLALFTLAIAGMVIAQPQAGQRGQRGGQRGQRGPGQRGGFGDRNPEEMRRMIEERIAERMKEQLEITDEEWKVLQPRMRKVMELTQQTRGPGGRGPGGPGGMFGRPGGPRPGGDGNQGQPQNEVQKANDALRSLLDGENPSAEGIKAKLTALRNAREKAKQELTKAQQELRQLLTLKQEARLVLMGFMP